MKEILYVFNDTILKRRNNTIWCEKNLEDRFDEGYDFKMIKDYLLDRELLFPSGEKKCIPIEELSSIFAFGIIHINSDLLFFLSKHKIPMHVFNVYGRYMGSYYPPKDSGSGEILIEQTLCYRDTERRLAIAKEIIHGSAENMLTNLKYAASKEIDLYAEIMHMENLIEQIQSAATIQDLLGHEGYIKRLYYDCWNRLITQPVKFEKRSRKPPLDPVNVLISYGNAVLYSMVLDEIYHTRLYPEIGFMHEPGDNKFPLAYDIADIFKPITIDRVIFMLFNKIMITEDDFTYKNDYCTIKDKAKRLYIKEIDNKMHATLKSREYDKEMSYRRLIRGECHKIIKCLYYNEEYKAYKSRW